MTKNLPEVPVPKESCSEIDLLAADAVTQGLAAGASSCLFLYVSLEGLTAVEAINCKPSRVTAAVVEDLAVPMLPFQKEGATVRRSNELRAVLG